MVLYDFFSDILTVILPFLLVLLSLSFSQLEQGLSFLFIFSKNQSLRSLMGVCVSTSPMSVLIFIISFHQQSLDLVCSCFTKKKMRCNIKPFSCFRFDFLMHALRAINFPPMTAFNVFQRVFVLFYFVFSFLFNSRKIFVPFLIFFFDPLISN